jgi:uncharacterized protein (DUF983 family)
MEEDDRRKSCAEHTCRCGETTGTMDLVVAVGKALDRGIPHRCPKCGDASAWIAARLSMMQGYRSACTTAVRNVGDSRWNAEIDSSTMEVAIAAAQAVAAAVARTAPEGVDDGGECRIPYCGGDGPLVGCCSVGKHALHAACLISCMASPTGGTCPMCRDGFLDVLVERCVLPRLCLPVLCGRETDPYSATASATFISWLRFADTVKGIEAARG